MTEPKLRLVSIGVRRTLSTNLRRFRRARRLTQDDLARICTLHRSWIGAMERGQCNPRLATLETLARGLGISVVQLLSPGDLTPSPETRRWRNGA